MEFKDFSRLCEPVLFISLLTCRCNTSCFLKLPQDLLSHIRVSMVCSCSISGYSLIIPFTIIRACMEGGGRKKPSTGRIRELPFSWYSGQWQWNQRQKIPILLKSNINGNNILFYCSIELGQTRCKRIFQGSLSLFASFEFATSCHKIKVGYMRSNCILFLVNLNMCTVNDNGYGELVSFVCNQGRI